MEKQEQKIQFLASLQHLESYEMESSLNPTYRDQHDEKKLRKDTKHHPTSSYIILLFLHEVKASF